MSQVILGLFLLINCLIIFSKKSLLHQLKLLKTNLSLYEKD